MEFVTPEGIAAPIGDGFHHAVVAGGVVYVSGQVGMEPDGSLPETFEGQAHRAFENLVAVLGTAGVQLEDVVKVTVCLVDRADLPAYRLLREQYLRHRPASTLLITGLALPALLFEIEAVAVVR